DTSLFVKPEDFHTITLNIISTLSINNSNAVDFDPYILFASCDKQTKKEIWRFKKTYSQIYELDIEIRSTLVDSFTLPPIPDKSLFITSLPIKIDQRRTGLNDYFKTLISLNNLPYKLIYRICKFISLNVINPLDDVEFNFNSNVSSGLEIEGGENHDIKKHGYLIKRSKAISGNSWKVRYAKCDGPSLDLHLSIGGQLVESIRLPGAQIGKQTTESSNNSNTSPYRDNSNESQIAGANKGYRHAFLIMEPKKATLSSNPFTRHIFCCETDEERDEWVNALIDFTLLETSTSSEKFNSSESILFNDNASRHTHSRGKMKKRNFFSNFRTKHRPAVSLSQQEQSSSRNNSEKNYNHGKRGTSVGVSTLLNFPMNNEDSSSSKKNDSESVLLQPVTQLSQLNGSNDQLPTPNMPIKSYQYPRSLSNTNIKSIQETLNNMNLSEGNPEHLFGVEINKAFKLSSHSYKGKDIPSIIFRCIDYLNQTGAIYEEGLFRVSGSSTTIKNLKEEFDSKFDLDLCNPKYRPDIHCITGLLKLYLRELPSPLISATNLASFSSVIKDYEFLVKKGKSKFNPQNKSSDAYLNYIMQFKRILSCEVSDVNSHTLYALISYLVEVIKNEDMNKMNVKNISIVFSPTLHIDTKILIEFISNYKFYWEKGDYIQEIDRKEVESINIPFY
ncbi:GTPase-activating protein BEM3, partial [Ascoidea rubescens DSM 1968]